MPELLSAQLLITVGGDQALVNVQGSMQFSYEELCMAGCQPVLGSLSCELWGYDWSLGQDLLYTFSPNISVIPTGSNNTAGVFNFTASVPYDLLDEDPGVTLPGHPIDSIIAYVKFYDATGAFISTAHTNIVRGQFLESWTL